LQLLRLCTDAKEFNFKDMEDMFNDCIVFGCKTTEFLINAEATQTVEKTIHISKAWNMLNKMVMSPNYQEKEN
jgi:hypothetical protein